MAANKHTHRHEGELVVFLIGMKVRRWWRVDAWAPAFRAMPRMLTELSKDPESGLLSHRLAIGPDGPLVIQYWSSLDKLYAYAADQTAQHRPAWTAFNRRARKVPGAVGIWHETFVIEKAESIYVDMPVRGLAAGTAAVPLTRDRAAARMKLGSTAA